MKNKSLFFIVFALFFTACSSPESDGKKAAEKFCDCEQEGESINQKEYSSLIQNFDSYNFKTRLKMREEIRKIDNEVNEQKKECLQKAQQYRQKLNSRYESNYTERAKFEYAYQSYIDANRPAGQGILPLSSQIEVLILSIIPAKPDEEKIKQDLVGRTITKNGDEYRNTKRFLIESIDQINNLQILRTEENTNDNYRMEVYLELKSPTTLYEEIGRAHV